LIPAGDAARQPEILNHALDLLGGNLLLAHAKDHDASGKVVAPGDGVIDLAGFAAGLKAAGFAGPLIGHGFDPADARRAAKVLRSLCDAA
jgi:sugar phosphate isomerase/epimerase